MLEGNGIDLVYAPDGESTTLGNCLSGNEFVSSSPADIETVLSCPGTDRELTVELPPVIDSPPGVDYRTMEAPGAQLVDASARRNDGGRRQRPAGRGPGGDQTARPTE